MNSPKTLIGVILSQGTATSVLKNIEPEFILATEFLTLRNEQTTGAYDVWEDMDMLKVIVAQEHADQVFEQLYHYAKIEHTEGAYMYQHALANCTDYQLPDLPPKGLPVDALDDAKIAGQYGLNETDLQNLKRLIDN